MQKTKGGEKLTLETCFCWDLVLNEGDAASTHPTGAENTGLFSRNSGRVKLTVKINMFWGSGVGKRP